MVKNMLKGNPLKLKDIFEIQDDYDCFLFDLWGVLTEGDFCYPGVIDNLRKLIANKKQVFFISNAPRPVRHSVKVIDHWGIRSVTPDTVITSGEVCRDFIKNAQKDFNIEPVVYHLEEDRNDNLMEDLECNFTQDIEKANILVISTYRDEWENLNELDPILKRAAERGIFILCANPDIEIPNNMRTRYCSGFFGRKVEEEFGGKVIYTGKPEKIIYEKLFKKIDPSIKKDRILMIGDTLNKDILGAKRMGIKAALVMTGNARKLYDYRDHSNNQIDLIYQLQ
jgi:HAD superfamily hydrolase (TIGR01459 family)